MTRDGAARLAVYVAPEDACAGYYVEPIEFFGFRHDPRDGSVFAHLAEYDVLALCGNGALRPTQIERVEQWMRAGGRVVCSGSTWGLERALGVRPDPERHPSTARVIPAPGATDWWPEGASPARFFGGCHVLADGCRTLAVTDLGGVAASVDASGSACFFAPHVGQTMSLMQLGRSVECDGIGPTDGSARLDDQTLRTEDGIALDFDTDRDAPVEGATRVFLQPHSDVIQEAWLGLVLRALVACGRPVVALWPWPNHDVGATVVSVECLDTDVESALALTALFGRVGARAAWLVHGAGYPADFYRALRNRDHDIGLLFGVEEDTWSVERLKSQSLSLGRGVVGSRWMSARPVSGRWRGRSQFYAMMQVAGPRISLSKGGRQPGTSGFGFGTCRPFFVRPPDGSGSVLEIPYAAHQPGNVASLDAVGALAQQAALRHGCMHVVFGSRVLSDPKMQPNVTQVMLDLRRTGLVAMTPGEIYARLRELKALRYRSFEEEKVGLQLIADHDFDDLGLLVWNVPHEAIVEGKQVVGRRLRRFGLDAAAFRLHLEAKKAQEVLLWSEHAQAA